MTSEKLNKLEQAQRSLVHKIYYVDQNSIPKDYKLTPMIQNDFKKMKSSSSISRIFKDHNKRYFTFNLFNMVLFYTPHRMYSIDSICYLPFEELREVRDKPHYAISNQGVEWRDIFGFTLYFHDRFIILITKSQDIYNNWLNHLEMVRWRVNNQSILKRERTQYLVKLNLIPLVLQQNLIEEKELEKKISHSNKNNDESCNTRTPQNLENKEDICQLKWKSIQEQKSIQDDYQHQSAIKIQEENLSHEENLIQNDTNQVKSDQSIQFDYSLKLIKMSNEEIIQGKSSQDQNDKKQTIKSLENFQDMQSIQNLIIKPYMVSSIVYSSPIDCEQQSKFENVKVKVEENNDYEFNEQEFKSQLLGTKKQNDQVFQQILSNQSSNQQIDSKKFYQITQKKDKGNQNNTDEIDDHGTLTNDEKSFKFLSRNRPKLSNYDDWDENH